MILVWLLRITSPLGMGSFRASSYLSSVNSGYSTIYRGCIDKCGIIEVASGKGDGCTQGTCSNIIVLISSL